MKQLLTTLLVLVNLAALGQNHQWTVSFSSGLAIGGPAASIKKQMKDQGFDQQSQYNFFGFSGTASYPKYVHGASLLLRVTRKINETRSLFFTGGRVNGGEVSGFRNQGYTDFILIGSSYGPSPRVKFDIWQLSGGLQFNAKNGHARFGLGPSLYLVNYAWNNTESNKKLSAGLTAMARLPLGKERRAVGLEWFIDLNMAPSVDFSSGDNSETGFKPEKAGMFSAGSGLALTWRKHTKK